MKKVISLLILLCFFLTSVMGPNPVYAQDFRLPAPGVMVHLSPPLNPPILKGIKVHPDNPFRFDFILDQGEYSPPQRPYPFDFVRLFRNPAPIKGGELLSYVELTLNMLLGNSKRSMVS